MYVYLFIFKKDYVLFYEYQIKFKTGEIHHRKPCTCEEDINGAERWK